MCYYLICFAVSAFLFWLGQNIKLERCEKIIRWSAYGAALLIPAVLAGIRADSVGKDMLFYAVPMFEYAQTATSFGDLLNHDYFGRMEPGYLWLNYAIAQSTNSRILFFGLMMFTQLLFVFLTLNQWKDKFPLWVGMLVFYLLFFNLSLNLMRQMLALSIAFFGMKYVFKREFSYFSFWVLLGFLFHYSALLLLLYYPLFWYTNKFTSPKSVILFIGISIAGIMLLLPLLADFLSSLGGIFSKISFYITRTGEEDGFPFNSLMFYALPTVLFFINRETILSAFPKISYFFQYIMALLIILPFVFFYGGTWAYRFSFLVVWWFPVIIPVIFYSFDKFPKILLNIAVLSYCFFYWYFTAIYQNTDATAHYLTVFGN